MDLTGDIDSNTTIMENFKNQLSSKHKSSWQKINQEAAELFYTMEQMYVIGIYRISHLTIAKYTFFSLAHGIYSGRDHMLGQKTSLSKFKKLKSLCFLSGYHGVNMIISNLISFKNMQMHGDWTESYWMLLGGMEEIKRGNLKISAN